MPKDKSTGKKLADMMYGNPEGAAFGITPMIGKRREDRQDREAAKSFPVDLARGVTAGFFGMPADILNLPGAVYSAVTDKDLYKIPYGSEDILKSLPFGTETPAGQFASGLGSIAGGSANIGPMIRGAKALPGALKTAARNLSTPRTMSPEAGAIRVKSPGALQEASGITREGNPIQGAVVLIGDRMFMGRTHGDALNRAVYEGVVRKEGGKYIFPKGAEVNSDLFITNTGQIIDRYQALKMADIGASETAIEKGLMQNNPARSMSVDSYMEKARALKQQRDKFQAPQDEAMRLAQQRAALPVEQGGLGLSANNTAEQRAAAMGFDRDTFHGSLRDINKLDPRLGSTESHAGRGVYSTDSPEDASLNYASIYGPDVTGRVERGLEERDKDFRKIYGRMRDEVLTPRQQEIILRNTAGADNLGVVYPLKVRADKSIHLDAPEANPVRIGPFESYDEVADAYVDTPHTAKFREALDEFGELGGEANPIYEVVQDGDGPVPARDVFNAVKKTGNESGLYDPYTGDIVSGGVAAGDFVKHFGIDEIRHTPEFRNQQLNIGNEHTISLNPDNVRSRFAAFDPFRKDVATAAAMGVLAPDLLAKEKDEGKKRDKETKKAGGGRVHFSDNPDVMALELAKGGAIRMQAGGLPKRLIESGAKAIKALKPAKEAAVPLTLPRVRPTTKDIFEAAERVGKQQAGEFVRSPILKDTTNLAGRSKKEVDRLKEMEYKLTPIKDLPVMKPYEAKVGEVNIALPGDQTVSDMLLESVDGVPIGVTSEGGALFGRGRLADPEDKRAFWASNVGPAGAFQRKVTELARLYDTDMVTAYHLAMGQTANNFAQHLAEANMRAIDFSKLDKKKMDLFDREIAEGFLDKKDKVTGEKTYVTFPEWMGIASPEEALAAMKENPELRKWFNDRMKTEKSTKKSDLPYGKSIEWAMTEPELRNMEINLTGLSAGRMKPGAELIPDSAHQTYSHDIPGTALGRAPELSPFSISFPDATAFVREKYRPQDFTGTIQKVFPHQVVDEAYLEDMYKYYTQLRKVRGYKKGGAVHKAAGGEITADDLILEERKL